MTDVFNPVTVEAKLLDLSNKIATGVNMADDGYRAFLKADHDYDVAYAMEWGRAAELDIPANQRKYHVELKTIDERQARDNADAAYRYIDRRTKAYEAELRAMQSVGASVRQAYSVAGRGES